MKIGTRIPVNADFDCDSLVIKQESKNGHLFLNIQILRP